MSIWLWLIVFLFFRYNQRPTQGTSNTPPVAQATSTTSHNEPSIIINPKDGMELIRIPGGTYPIGSDSGFSDEKPAHTVTLKPYAIGKYEVTNAQYRKFVQATGHHTDGDWEECARKWGEQAPVVEVSWHDANAYCKWAGLRLPTEAEWEAAARGPKGLIYPWGNTWDASRCRSSVGRGYGGANNPVAVGSYPTGASPFGCRDMAGNVWEWCASKYGPYPYDASDGREDLMGSQDRILRGCSWYYPHPDGFRVAERVGSNPSNWTDSGGFRSARTL